MKSLWCDKPCSKPISSNRAVHVACYVYKIGNGRRDVRGKRAKVLFFRKKGKIDIVLSIFTMRMGVPIQQGTLLILAKVLDG